MLLESGFYGIKMINVIISWYVKIFYDGLLYPANLNDDVFVYLQLFSYSMMPSIWMLVPNTCVFQ